MVGCGQVLDLGSRSRADEHEYAPLQAAFVQTCRALGAKDQPDLNAPDAEGVGSAAVNRVGTTRMSTATTHLAPTRGRPDLTVRGDLHVRRVTFDGTTATGVELTDGTVIGACEVVLTAGAIQTAACCSARAWVRRRCCPGWTSRSCPTCRSGRTWATTSRVAVDDPVRTRRDRPPAGRPRTGGVLSGSAHPVQLVEQDFRIDEVRAGVDPDQRQPGLVEQSGKRGRAIVDELGELAHVPVEHLDTR